jgi:eukaryotic-like serine/threonine-protein kinase
MGDGACVAAARNEKGSGNMTPEAWQEIKKVLAEALERTPEQRSAYLDQACPQPDKRREVESLLLADKQAQHNFLSGPALGSTEELAVGRRLGIYEIVARIGAGGMGDVYQARDTKLGRSVAIKILRLEFDDDPERLSRFQREARLLASLNHPNIATIYGLEQSGETQYLVMELVPGKTLAERLKTGPLDIAEALAIAQQTCAALESAHEQGIVHRDLKPANVEVLPDGRIKVLDFGLAKAFAGEFDADTQRGLAKAAGSEAGTILGTPAYMSPEQVRGKSVDKRADIWAFGCVFYEMLSGRRAFDAESITEVLAAVLTEEPEWSNLPQTTPPAIQRLLRRCLVKEPKQRLRDIGDARITIEEVRAGAGVPQVAAQSSAAQQAAAPQHKTSWWHAARWAIAPIAILIPAFAAYFLARPKKPGEVIRFSVSAPANTSFRPWASFLSLSPDGRKLAFMTGGAGQGKATLAIRAFDSLSAESFPGVEGGYFPFWSPDSRYIGFFAEDGKLEKVPVSGGPPQVLCDASSGGGGTWNRDGVIIFSDGDKLYRVPEAGGTPTPVAAAEETGQKSFYFFPQFLPDQRHFLFFRIIGTTHRGYGRSFVEVGSLDSTKTERLFESLSEALYAPPGYLLYVEQATLVAQAFDADRLRSTGQPVPIVTGVGLSRAWNYGLGYFSLSQNGVLAYQTGPGGPVSEMTWYSRKGETLGTVAEPGVRLTPALSHDETKIAVPTGEIGRDDIWVYDLKRGVESRLTVTGDNFNPVWSPDGKNLMYSSWRSGHLDIYKQAANGLGNAEPISDSQDPPKALNDVSPDGRYAIYDTAGSTDLTELWVLSLFGEHKLFPFVQGGGFGAREAQFSPDGRYVAYASHESGKYEIYVQSFPQHLGKWQISTRGGEEPAWRRDGKELFYLTPENKLMAVEVHTVAGQFQAAIPKPLFQAQLVQGLLWRNRYVVSANGQQFLMLSPVRNSEANPITVVLNWPALLEGK